MKELYCALQNHAIIKKILLYKVSLVNVYIENFLHLFNYNIKRVNVLFKNMNIYPNTCSLQEDSKDSETGQVNFTL